MTRDKKSNEWMFYKNFFDNSSELIHSLDQQGCFLRVNKAWKNTLGYTDADLSHISIWDIMKEDSIEHQRQRFQQVKHGEEFAHNQMTLKKKNGGYVELEGSSRAVFDENGRFYSTQGIFRDVTGEKMRQRRTEQTLHRLQALLTQSPSGIILFDETGKYLEISDSISEMLGRPKNEIIGKTFHDMFTEGTAEKYLQDTKQLLKQYEPIVRKDILQIHGKEVVYESRLFRISSDEEGSYIFGAIVNDITKQKALEEAIYTEKELFRTTLMSVGDGIISTDENGKVHMMNPVAEKLTGWSMRDAFGMPMEAVFQILDDQRNSVSENPAQFVLRTGKVTKTENHTILISRSGTETFIEDVAAPIKDKKGQLTGAVLVFRDSREKLEKQKQIEYLSFHDHLTGLYNRRYMEDALKRLDTSRNLPLTIMVLDVNGLKLTNDAFGHETGDKLLIMVTKILKSVCRSDDLIGRIGGDEFLILFPNTDEKSAELIRQRINSKAKKKKLGSVIVSVAIGYAIKTTPEENVEVIEQDADNNMYRDKIKNGKSMKTGTIQAILNNVYKLHKNEEKHTRHVAKYCKKMARALNFTSAEVELIMNAALLHDVGKIIIPDRVLKKDTEYSKDEMEIVRRHAETSYQILKSVDDFAYIADVVLHHHERWDGKGYPQGLKGESIPIMSRIMSIADSYEAMISDRSYRKQLTEKEAIDELRACSGTQFDPVLVEVFISKVLKLE